MSTFRCLAVETATERAGVALLDGDRCLEKGEHGLREPSRLVYRWIDELLREARISLEDLDCIAFGAGPGSFTGLRVAAGVAQALAFSRTLPVCRVSTLAALALGQLRATGGECVAVALDARMGQAYAGVYRRRGAGVEALVEDALVDPEHWAPVLPAGTRAAGPGFAAWPVLATGAGIPASAVDPACWPAAADVARLGQLQFEAGLAVGALDALPNYLRERVTSSPPPPAGTMRA